MIANAAPVTRGSCRRGSASRPVSGAIASQPTKASITEDAALPTAIQPWATNGVQFAARPCGSEPIAASAATTIRVPTSTSCTEVPTRVPPRVMTTTATSSTPAASTAPDRPQPNSAATYQPPIRQTTGAPSTAPATKHQATTRLARGPSPAAV